MNVCKNITVIYMYVFFFSMITFTNKKKMLPFQFGFNHNILHLIQCDMHENTEMSQRDFTTNFTPGLSLIHAGLKTLSTVVQHKLT